MENPHDEGMNHIIGSGEHVPTAAERSQKMRAPLRDMEIKGERTKDKVRPFHIEHSVTEVERCDGELPAKRSYYEQARKAAATVSRGIIASFFTGIAVLADGWMLAPVIAEAIGSFEDEWKRIAVGMSAALIIALGGAGVASSLRPIVPKKYGRIVSALVAGLLTGALGFYIGKLGDEREGAAMLRAFLTGAVGVAMSACHFALAEAHEAWGPVRMGRKLVQETEKTRDKNLGATKDYQEEGINMNENHNRGECERVEGMMTGKQAREDGVRTSYITKKFGSWAERLLGAVVVATSLSVLPSYAFAGNKDIVLDVTGSIPNVPALADRLAKEVKFDFGDTVSAYIIDNRGLTHVFSGEIRRVSQPGHRASREKVKAEMVAALKEAAKNADGGGSPIVSSLLTLATDLRVRSDKGEGLVVIVASDFASTDKAVAKGQPFASMNIIAVLPPADGHSPTKRQSAIELAQKIFSGAKLHFAQ